MKLQFIVTLECNEKMSESSNILILRNREKMFICDSFDRGLVTKRLLNQF